MGKLNNPPIVYGLCEVKFNHLPLLKELIPVISEDFRKAGFSEHDIDSLKSVEIIKSNTDTQIKEISKDRWRFTRADLFSSFHLTNESISFQISKYQTKKHFREQLIIGLNILNLHIKGEFNFKRIGVRYTDLIHALADDNIEAYLNTNLFGCSFPDTQHIIGKTFSELKTKLGILTVQSEWKKCEFFDAKSFVLPDLMPIFLKHEKYTKENFPKDSYMILDMDHFWEGSETFDSKNIISYVEGLQLMLSSAFKDCTTDHARKQWNK